MVIRRPELRQQLATRWSLPAFASPEELVAATPPDFMMSVVSWAANPGIVETMLLGVEAGPRLG